MEQDSLSQEDSSSDGCDIPGYDSVNKFAQKGFTAVVQATRSSNELPVGDDYDFYSTYPAVREVMDIEGKRILTLMQKITRYHNVKGNIGPGADLDVEDRFDILMDANDQMLEKVGSLLDEASGIKKQESKLLVASVSSPKPSTSWNKTASAPNTEKAAAAYKLLTARHIQRPQLKFKTKIDNSARPFKPLIREKPNALKSLEDSLALPSTVTIDDSEQPDFVHPHPYAYELEQFSPDIASLRQRRAPEDPKLLSQTPLIMVNTPAQLQGLLEDLRKETDVAIDLEHHSYRSFQGITCLMQISTRSKDYIVDTLELRDKLFVLNEVFTNSAITKVLHGADSDIVWLQKDFGLYLVNLFDTGLAARVLGLSRFSLAHLLMVYLRIEANKQFQLADWRIRPLPEELIKYAREDTHYLLYIYDIVRNQLLDRSNEQANLLQSVFQRSKAVASQVYRKPVFTEEHYQEFYMKSKKAFNTRQLVALKSLCTWRDQKAREEDESYGYVLPNHMLLQIAEILPRERQGVLACCNPIPPLVRQSLPEIHNFILQAREITLGKVEKTPAPKPSLPEHPKYNPDSLLNCPHDMTRHDEQIAQIEKSISETGLITSSSPALGSRLKGSVSIEIKGVPVISAFSGSGRKMTRTAAKKLADKVKSLFSNPLSKYLPKELRRTERKSAVVPKWRLKPPTNPKNADKKATKLDLDSFEPEFVPPTKKPKMSINLLSASSKPTPSDSSKSNGILAQAGSSGSQGVFRVPAVPPINTAATSALVSPTSTENKEVTEKKKKKKKKKKDKESKTLKQEALQIKKAKKKKEKRQRLKEQLSQETATSSSSLDSASTSTTVSQDDKKKKKKKKVSINDIGKNFAAFNYDAAEEQLKKEWKEQKKLAVFNPHVSSKKKDKGKKGSKTKSSAGKKKTGTQKGV